MTECREQRLNFLREFWCIGVSFRDFCIFFGPAVNCPETRRWTAETTTIICQLGRDVKETAHSAQLSWIESRQPDTHAGTRTWQFYGRSETRSSIRRGGAHFIKAPPRRRCIIFVRTFAVTRRDRLNGRKKAATPGRDAINNWARTGRLLLRHRVQFQCCVLCTWHRRQEINNQHRRTFK